MGPLWDHFPFFSGKKEGRQVTRNMLETKDLKEIKNKHKRNEIYHKLKSLKSREKLKKRMSLKAFEKENQKEKEKRLQENKPSTIESKREFDETMLLNHRNPVEYPSQRKPETMLLNHRNPVEYPSQRKPVKPAVTSAAKSTSDHESDHSSDGHESDDCESDSDHDDGSQSLSGSESQSLSGSESVHAKKPQETDQEIKIDMEVLQEQEQDEFEGYFYNEETPKILITTSKRPTKAVYEFAHEFASIFPDAQFVKRGPQFEISNLVEIAKERNYTKLIIINEDRKTPNAITMIHLPEGPTAYFDLTSIKLNKHIRGHGKLGPHKPELILNNFNTRLGHTIGRLFASLFPKVPEFQGRQACTLHNQRDFIFFRRHRYVFRNGEKVDIQEIGPRFTLKLKWLQKGTFNRKYGEYVWMHKPDLDTSRTKFHL